MKTAFLSLMLSLTLSYSAMGQDKTDYTGPAITKLLADSKVQSIIQELTKSNKIEFYGVTKTTSQFKSGENESDKTSTQVYHLEFKKSSKSPEGYSVSKKCYIHAQVKICGEESNDYECSTLCTVEAQDLVCDGGDIFYCQMR